MVSRRSQKDSEPRKGRITIERRVGKIGFLGRGIGRSPREKSDIAHRLSLRMDEDLIAEARRERERCRDDARPHPGILRRVFSKEPEVVVFPDSGQCAADILDLCIEERTPAVPRGLGSAGLGGAVPLRGGVVIDLSKMCEVVSLDRERPMVTVDAGCTWQRLEARISAEGLSLSCYPSNKAGGTVGGWLSTGGYGVGTLVSGRFQTTVEDLEVAVPSGILLKARHGEGRYSLESFAGTEGQLGVVTRLTLRLRSRPERRAHCAIRLERLEDGVRILRDLADMDPPPFGTRFVWGNVPGLSGRAGEGETLMAPVVSALFESTEESVSKALAGVEERLSTRGLDLVGGEEARDLFETPLTLVASRLERTLVRSGEVLIGLDRLQELMEILEGASGGRTVLEVQVVDRNLALVMAYYMNEGEGLPAAIRDVPATFGIVQRALRCGGRPYGVGLWNTPLAGPAVGKVRKALKVIKGETDRLAILNPGKFFALTTNSGLPVRGLTYRIGLGVLRLFFQEGGVK